MVDKIKAELKSLEEEFTKVKNIANNLDEQRKQAHERMLQLQGAYQKLNDMVKGEEPEKVEDGSTPASA